MLISSFKKNNQSNIKKLFLVLVGLFSFSNVYADVTQNPRPFTVLQVEPKEPPLIPYDSKKSFIEQIAVHGKLRLHQFVRDYAKLSDQSSLTFAGGLNFLTPTIFKYFQANASFYTEESLHLSGGDSRRIDPSLPPKAVNVVGQSYLQFRSETLLFRAGNQLINTPWMNAADSREIPATFTALYGKYSPVKNIDFIFLRAFAFKERISSQFTRTNLYNSSSDGTSIPGLGSTTDSGALAFGLQGGNPERGAKVWYYQFYDFSKLFYVDGTYKFPKNASSLRWFFSGQALYETADGKDDINRVTGKTVGSSALGALVGVETPSAEFSVGYNYIPTRVNGFNGGGIVSPYTSGYVSDPLYTKSMIAGLVEKGAGQAFKLTAIFYRLEKQLQIESSFAYYYTTPHLHNTNEFDLDIEYAFKGKLKGFYIRNRIGILNGNQVTGTFVFNRVMLQYVF
ncbi:MAG: hypothetical protein JSS53_07225 [Proteobacteria bacterium]|nr:hypothetical protein [Pseudomonadota bacterium]